MSDKQNVSVQNVIKMLFSDFQKSTRRNIVKNKQNLKNDSFSYRKVPN